MAHAAEITLHTTSHQNDSLGSIAEQDAFSLGLRIHTSTAERGMKLIAQIVRKIRGSRINRLLDSLGEDERSSHKKLRDELVMLTGTGYFLYIVLTGICIVLGIPPEPATLYAVASAILIGLTVLGLRTLSVEQTKRLEEALHRERASVARV